MKHGVHIVAAIFLESNDLISFFSHFFNIALFFMLQMFCFDITTGLLMGKFSSNVRTLASPKRKTLADLVCTDGGSYISSV